MAAGISPLDEAVGLRPGALSPWLTEATVRLGTWLPFEQVPEALTFFTGVIISVETARRLTETAGRALVAVEDADLAHLEATLPPPPAGPPVQQLSIDGAMVPLMGGQWGEVKLLAVGTVGVQPQAQGPPAVHTRAVSYLARMTDATTFGRLATLETHRRGTETAGRVAAVLDGAVWQQGVVDLQRPDAHRILDFPHAAEHLLAPARLVLGMDTPALRGWQAQWLHELQHGTPAAALGALGALPVEQAPDPAAATAAIGATLEYFAARWEQVQYATFLAQGLPIGSGMVESGHKVVTQARLKGPGMHWAPANVNPMLALRGAVCNDRWTERWAAVVRQRQTEVAVRRRVRRAPCPAPPAPLPPPAARPAAPPRAASAALTRPKRIVDGRPTADHPWRRPFLPPRSAAPTAKP